MDPGAPPALPAYLHGLTKSHLQDAQSPLMSTITASTNPCAPVALAPPSDGVLRAAYRPLPDDMAIGAGLGQFTPQQMASMAAERDAHTQGKMQVERWAERTVRCQGQQQNLERYHAQKAAMDEQARLSRSNGGNVWGRKGDVIDWMM